MAGNSHLSWRVGDGRRSAARARSLKETVVSNTPRDPIGFEVFKNMLLSIADEMALTILRTSYSGILKDNMDYSTAFADAEGRTVAQGLTLPAHLASFPDALAATLERYSNRMRPGDVYCLNDPFEGGMHLPDVFILKPIFYEGERIAFATTICHQTDMGGRVAGSNASDSTEIFQEGLRIPPVKMYDAGEPNETLFRLLEKNVRLPVRVLGDMRAQLAACHIAEESFLRLLAKHGTARVKAYMEEILDYTERMTRAAVCQLPDGEWSFTDWIDDDGIDFGRPIPLNVTLRKKGDHLVVDWTGSSPQVKGAINNTLSYTKAATYTCMKSVLPPDIPCNAGFYRAIDVIAPPGTIANAVPPAACAARGLTGFRMVDTCFGALAQMLPDRIVAASEGGNTGVSIGGYYPDRTPFIFVEFFCTAWGGRPWADGLDGNANLFTNMSLPSAEMTEIEQPLEILCCELIQDAGGPGRYRGGMSVRRDYRLLEEEAVLQVRADRRIFRPYGLYGGKPGRPSRNVLNPASEHRELTSKVTMTIQRDDVFRHEQPGAGGWGDPLQRDPAWVLRDVRNELVSFASARDDYGIVLDPSTWTIDEGATTRLRDQLRLARGWSEIPSVTR
ncbi:MAG: hydantoinase B/oxoprolinase family protein [Acidobacteria bacterium]|nr:hydantoinase B/oxoprolinase family protein [Acidobacteriota bacterium]